MSVLRWIFSEALIRRCFDVSMRTVDARGKEAISVLINQMCGTHVGDMSRPENQCECLLEAILVLLSFTFHFFLFLHIFIYYL